MFVKPLDNEQIFVYNTNRVSRNIVCDYMITHEKPFVKRVCKFLKNFGEIR